MKNSKRILSFVCALVMVGSLNVCAFADDFNDVPQPKAGTAQWHFEKKTESAPFRKVFHIVSILMEAVTLLMLSSLHATHQLVQQLLPRNRIHWKKRKEKLCVCGTNRLL